MNIGSSVRCIAAAAALALALGAADRAGAADGAVTVELNKLEDNGQACRAYLVVQNETQAGFQALNLDLVMFDTDGIIANRLAVDAAPLPVGKTSLKVFDIDGLPCPRIGRLLLNDVIACVDDGGERTGCLSLVETGSRSPVGFIK